MEAKKKPISSDYDDAGYRVAVDRLKSMLEAAEPCPSSDGLDDEQDSQLPHASYKHRLITYPVRRSPTTRRSLLASFVSKPRLSPASSSSSINVSPTKKSKNSSDMLEAANNADISTFLEKQDEYIDQLEQETQYCREQVSVLTTRVKNLVGENARLHDNTKLDFRKNILEVIKKNEEEEEPVGDKKLEAILYKSKVSELQAQLTNAKIQLKVALEENTKKKITGQDRAGLKMQDCELHKDQIDCLVREKHELMDKVNNLEAAIIRVEKEKLQHRQKVQESIGVADEAQVVLTMTDKEVKRLKEENARQQQRMKDMIRDHTRKLQDEKQYLEKKYDQQLDILRDEVTAGTENTTQYRIDMDKQKRLEAELRREIQQKVLAMDDLRQETQMKIGTLQSELNAAMKQTNNAEQEIINLKSQIEKLDRDNKQEKARAQVEIQGVRKRLDLSDHKLMERGEECTRLAEIVSHLERDLNMTAKHTMLVERNHSEDVMNLTERAEIQDREITDMMKALETKHATHINELEAMIKNQNKVLDTLRSQSQNLTLKLDENTARYKKEKSVLKSKSVALGNELHVKEDQCYEFERQCRDYKSEQNRMTKLIAQFEAESNDRSEKIFKLIMSQTRLYKENQEMQDQLDAFKARKELLAANPVNQDNMSPTKDFS